MWPSQPSGNNRDARRRAVGLAMEWAHRLIAIAASMAVPALIGFWLDGVWQSTPFCLLLGLLLGCTAGIVQLVSLSSGSKSRDQLIHPPEGSRASTESKSDRDRREE